MNKKRLITLTAVIAIVAVSSLLVWSITTNPITPYYYKNILRDTNSSEEQTILETTE